MTGGGSGGGNGAALLEAHGLSRRFGGVQAARSVSLVVPQGSIAALIGPNGAGKTTTFAMLAGFVRADSGTVRLGSEDVTGWRPERIAAAGMVRTFQITQPFAGLTVAENIRVGAFLREGDPRRAMDAAREVGTRLGLGPMLDRAAASLTVAGRKRLEVARALATQPRLLLLDEVMAGLNPAEVSEVIGLIRDVRDGGTTILLIEHLMQAVAALADQVHVLAEGALIATGSPREIASDPRVVEAYLGHGAAKHLHHA